MFTALCKDCASVKLSLFTSGFLNILSVCSLTVMSPQFPRQPGKCYMNYLLLHLHLASVLFLSLGKYGQENLFFHCSSFFFSQEKKKNVKRKKCCWAPSPLTPPTLNHPWLFSHGWSFQTIGCVHRGINGFCEASQPMEGTGPSSEWGTAGLPLLVTAPVFECALVVRARR